MGSILNDKIYNIWILNNSNEVLTKNILQSFYDVGNCKIKLHIISAVPKCQLKYSRFVSSYNYISGAVETWPDKICSIISEYENNYIIPSCENCVDFLIKHDKELLDLSKIHPVPKYEQFDIAKNKDKLAIFLANNNIRIPQTWNRDSIEEFYNNPVFPVLIKPINRSGGNEIVQCGSVEELRNYIKNYSNYILQEYIESVVVGGNILAYDGEILASTVQKDYLYYEDNFSPAKGIRIIKDDKIFGLVEEVVSLLEWNGVMNVDICKEKGSNKLYFIEINARYWASLIGSLKAGVNFPLISFYEAFNIDYKVIKKSDVYFSGIKAAISQKFNFNPDVADHNFSIFKETNIKYLLQDPVPAFISFFKNYFNNK